MGDGRYGAIKGRASSGLVAQLFGSPREEHGNFVMELHSGAGGDRVLLKGDSLVAPDEHGDARCSDPRDTRSGRTSHPRAGQQGRLVLPLTEESQASDVDKGLVVCPIIELFTGLFGGPSGRHGLGELIAAKNGLNGLLAMDASPSGGGHLRRD